VSARFEDGLIFFNLAYFSSVLEGDDIAAWNSPGRIYGQAGLESARERAFSQ